jgi:RNA polymerase sigma-B factor
MTAITEMTTSQQAHQTDAPSVTESLLRQRNTLAATDAQRARLRDEAILASLPLARRLARRYLNRGETLDDLYQVAALALVTAVDRYDPTRGAFEHYAIPSILGALKRHFRDNGWAMRVPRRQQDLVIIVNAAVGALSQRLSHTPSVVELAQHLDVSEADVRSALDAARCYRLTALDTPTADGSTRLIDMVGQDDPAYSEVDNRMTVQALLMTLPQQQQVLLTSWIFGGMTQSQIGAKLGVTQVHVSRLLSHVLRRLATRAAR